MRYLLLIATIVSFGGTSRADFMAGATGFTTLVNPKTGAKIPGIINFAVLDTKNSGYGDSWGTRYPNFDFSFVPGRDSMSHLSPRLDYRARYIYLYQLTNDNTQTPFESVAVRLLIHPRYITSWGYFEGLGFADSNDGETYTSVSAVHTFGVRDPHSEAGKATFRVYNPRVVSIKNVDDPGIDPHEVLIGSNAVRASWVGGPELVGPGRRGTIYGFTSDYPPTITDGSVVMHCGKPDQPPCPPHQ